MERAQGRACRFSGAEIEKEGRTLPKRGPGRGGLRRLHEPAQSLCTFSAAPALLLLGYTPAWQKGKRANPNLVLAPTVATCRAMNASLSSRRIIKHQLDRRLSFCAQASWLNRAVVSHHVPQPPWRPWEDGKTQLPTKNRAQKAMQNAAPGDGMSMP